jgi:glycosyltransferase involved in cell wall biosynthesis
MRIAIDASTLSTQGGPRSYVLGLLDALGRIDRENDYVVFYNDPVHMGRFHWAREIVLPGKSPLCRLWREHVSLPLTCRREKVDLLHGPKSAVPFWSPCPTVVTLHDLIPITHPETETRAAQLYWRLQIPIAARRASFIITDSDHARREIVEMFGIDDRRIAVTPLGYPPAMDDPPDPLRAATVRQRYGLPDSYILYVGTIQPRKNLDMLIEAYARLRDGGVTAKQLVIAGRKGWLYETLFARISALGLKQDVTFTGFVPDEDLPHLYDGACLFVYLSLFEGFGLPPLEAMARGIPVVTSNTTSLPEVVGDAGITVSPRSLDDVIEGMRRVLTDAALADKLSQAGKGRARQFSWERTARETLELYRFAAGSARSRND